MKIPVDTKVNPIIVQLLKRMLTKNQNKRADWNEVFSYEISEIGTIRWGKSSNFIKNMNDSTHSSLNNTSVNSSKINTNHSSVQNG